MEKDRALCAALTLLLAEKGPSPCPPAWFWPDQHESLSGVAASLALVPPRWLILVLTSNGGCRW
jgi:hypothetical protein